MGERLEVPPAACDNGSDIPEDRMTKPMTEGQRAYETKRAAKAGMSLDKWLDLKAREAQEEARAREEAAKPPAAPKPPGFFGRMLDKLHKPI